jgi:hypothetical protein
MPPLPAPANPTSQPGADTSESHNGADRDREIARLVGLWPSEIADVSAEGRARLVKKLEQVLKAERRRGQAGHWTYDLARHAALARVLRQERSALATLGRKTCAVHKKGMLSAKENAQTLRPARSISQSRSVARSRQLA